MIENGINQSEKLCIYHLYFLKKYAKNIISENFRNSVGCIAKGRKGRSIHQRAQFQLGHITSTTTSKNKLV